MQDLPAKCRVANKTASCLQGGMAVNSRPKPPENMAEFFNVRADGYDDHMRRTVVSFDEFYGAVAQPVEPTQLPVHVLDLGAGTGLELTAIFAKAPNARVTAVDLSPEMLARLKQKFEDRTGQLTVLRGSYLDLPLGDSAYDYAISVMTMHHLLPEVKLGLYRKVVRALRPGGVYVEGDYVVAEEKAVEFLEEYQRLARDAEDLRGLNDGLYHIDIPFSVGTQVELMRKAGFESVGVLWHQGEAAVITASRPFGSPS